MDRREFLRLCALTGLAAAGEGILGRTARAEETPWPREALLYEKLPGRRVRCSVCPRQCEVADGERGFCGVRENRGGVYYSLVYGRLCAVHSDPIEKKPLFHYLPGSSGSQRSHRRLQLRVQVLSELEHLPVPARTGA